MFSRPLFLTLEMPPRQILNRTNTHRVMLINMFAPEFQVLFKSLSAHLVSEPQGTKLFRFTLPVASFRKTHNRLKIDHHRIMVVTHCCNIKFTRNPTFFDSQHLQEEHSHKICRHLGSPIPSQITVFTAQRSASSRKRCSSRSPLSVS